jgi:hypothetical protein
LHRWQDISEIAFDIAPLVPQGFMDAVRKSCDRQNAG